MQFKEPEEVEESVRTVVTRYKTSDNRVFVHLNEARRHEASNHLIGLVKEWHTSGLLRGHPMLLVEAMMEDSESLSLVLDILSEHDGDGR